MNFEPKESKGGDDGPFNFSKAVPVTVGMQTIGASPKPQRPPNDSSPAIASHEVRVFASHNSLTMEELTLLSTAPWEVNRFRFGQHA